MKRLPVFFYIVSGLTIAFDQLTKIIALNNLTESIPVLPNVFHFTLVFNRGVAFGLFREHPEILLILISLSILVLLYVAHLSSSIKVSQQIIFGLIFGGAIGNWIDRLIHGAVIDFLDFRVWPVFNLADSAICVAVGIYVIMLWRTPHEGR